LCAAVLKKSGAYAAMLNPHSKLGLGTSKKAKELQAAGAEWRKALDGTPWSDESPVKPPDAVCTEWTVAIQAIESPLELFRLASRPDICRSLLDLLAISDEACRGLGLPLGKEDDKAGATHQFHAAAQRLLFPKQLGSTLCKTIHPSIARVLPKMHTAQSGLTIRSFSHHLAFCDSEEVRPSWISIPASIGDTESVLHMNVLIAPWPQVIAPKQIAEVDNREDKLPYYRFSVEVKETGGRIAEQLSALTEEAYKLVGKVDMVILPELAMTERDHHFSRSALLRKGILLISGVGSSDPASNYLTVDVPISKYHGLHFRQRKHHRWKLEDHQIQQYHLGSGLDPEKRYWENIDIQARQLRFFVIRPWLVTCALICEDLARHDPVGDLLKGVGPNLLIALLMDGPQIQKRWSSRYAAGYADDPGCSELSITSLGMAALSKPTDGDSSQSRTVALWKDGLSNVQKEIAVPAGYDGIVLTLSLRPREEETADFRRDDARASFPSLTGVHPVKLPGSLPEWPQAPKGPAWISGAEAGLLAQLAQRDAPKDGSETGAAQPHDALSEEFMPPELSSMHDVAFRIGREVWRLKTGGDRPSGSDPSDWAAPEETYTAEKIVEWDRRNRETEIGPGRHVDRPG
jgi:hypothetical protein